MSYAQYIEEVEFANSFADKFAGFDRGDAGVNDEPVSGEQVIGRLTNDAGQRVTIVESYCGDDSWFEVRVDGESVTELFDDRARAVEVARWWMDGCPA